MQNKLTLATGEIVPYKVDHTATFDGSHLQGYVIATYAKALAKLGQPEIKEKCPVFWNILVGFDGQTDEPLNGDSARYIIQLYLYDSSFHATTFNIHDAFEDYKDLKLKWHVGGSSPNILKYVMSILECKNKDVSFHYNNNKNKA